MALRERKTGWRIHMNSINQPVREYNSDEPIKNGSAAQGILLPASAMEPERTESD